MNYKEVYRSTPATPSLLKSTSTVTGKYKKIIEKAVMEKDKKNT